MITVSRNYTGRVVDLSIFPELNDPGVPVSAKFSTNSKAIAGPMAAVQNFARILLTPTGHYKSDPDLGTNFYSSLNSRHLRYPSDLMHLFLVESGKVLDYLARYSTGLPDDERLSAAELVGSAVTGTSIEMTIQFTTLAGSELVVRLPVQWSI